MQATPTPQEIMDAINGIRFGLSCVLIGGGILALALYSAYDVIQKNINQLREELRRSKEKEKHGSPK